MTISVDCQCGKTYSLPDDWQGKRFRCKTCNEIVVIPDGSSTNVFESKLPPSPPPFIDTSSKRQTNPNYVPNTEPAGYGNSDMSTAMIHCTACGGLMSNHAIACPKCGNPNPYKTRVSHHGTGEGHDWLTTLLLCLFAGGIGVHRFYTGHTAIGLVQLFTLGGCGIWTLVDLIMIVADSYRDSDGHKLVKR